MKFSVSRYMMILTILTVAVIINIALLFFTEQREKNSLFLMDFLRKELIEASHTLSVKLDSKSHLGQFESVLMRQAVKNPYVDAYLIADEHSVLLSTDHSGHAIPSSDEICNDLQDDLIFSSPDCRYLRQQITFFEGSEKSYLYLYMRLDRNAIHSYLDTTLRNAIVVFTLAAFGTALLLYFIHRRYLIRPLEKLRQYAYYQSDIPPSFSIKELEYIRASMVQTFSRLENEKKELYELSRTDQLSGLANRNALFERLGWLIAESSRGDREFALLFLDIDDFKDINDSMGHNIGDTLLRQVASYLQETLRAEDFVARIGGDEFVIIVNEFSSHLELTRIIQRILDKLKEPLVIESNAAYISGSIGVVLYPKDGQDIHALLKYADIAMYEAKRNGKDQYHFFTDALNQKVQSEIQLEKELREALADNQFLVYYQPKVEISTGKIVGSEALLRWNHPRLGIISPAQFITLAEQTGLIVPIGEWVMREAASQQRLWKEKAGFDLFVAVNFSVRQFHNDNFLKTFDRILAETGMDVRKLNIEITESLFLDNNERNLVILQNLKRRGIMISLDDFGTGYSSLSYLKKFPIDVLKIDKSFTDDYHHENGAAFIKTIIQMAKSLGIKVVAEGVEHHEQVTFLREAGCDIFQGYYASKPLPPDQFERLVSENPKFL